MKNRLLAFALAGMTGVFASPLLAADPKAPEPDFTITGNFGLVSDYRFRGVTQTRGNPAAQGGFDFTHKSGPYLGAWTSNVGQWANPGGSMEIDYYGGFRGALPSGGIGYDVGLIVYHYPGNVPTAATNPKNNSQEWYLGFSGGPISYKFYKTTGNWFGVARSSGSTYHDLNASFSLNEQVSISVHAGKQDIAGNSQPIDPDYTDYSIGLSFAMPNSFSLGVKVITVDFKNDRAGSPSASGWFTDRNKGLADDAIVLSLTKTF